MKLEVIKSAITSKAGMSLLRVRKHAPILLFSAGVVGVVGTVVLACKATMKLEAVLDGLDEDLEAIENGRGQLRIGDSDIDPARAKTLLYVKASVNILRLYAPAIGVGALSIAALTGSHVILTQRNTAAMAAYAMLQKGYDKYRQRVRDEFGDEQDQRFFHGVREREIVEETPEGPVTTVIKEVDPTTAGAYTKFFDELNSNYTKNPDENMYFLRCAMLWANQKLNAQGYLFLNELYATLDLPATKEGQLVGWVVKEGNQNYVDFGLFDVTNESARRFANGYEAAVRLTFNPDGIIYDQIGKDK